MNGRFYKLSADLAARRDLTWPTKGLLAYLADRQGNNGRAWPGLRRIAEDLGLSTNTVLRAVNCAERAGLLDVVRRGQGCGNCYRIGSASESVVSPNRQHLAPPNRSRAVSESETQALPNRRHNQKDPVTRPKKKTRAGAARGRRKGRSADLPTELDTADFRAAWAEWQQHRCELRKPLTPTAIRRQLAELVKVGAETAAAMIRQSVGRGWLGIFPLKDNTDGNRRASAARGRRSAAVPTDEDRTAYARFSGRG